MTKQLDIIHHIAIQVKDIKIAVNWYTKRFKCEVEYQDDSWAMLKFKNTSVALVLNGQHPRHFAILKEDISQYGEEVLHRDGTSSVYIKDNDDNSVEMLKLPKSIR